MAKQITDMLTWLLDNSDRIFAYQVHKKIFTPYEQEIKVRDESIYETQHDYVYGRIKEAIDLGSGEWLIGIRDCYEDLVDGEEEFVDFEMIEYYKLSDIKLTLLDEINKEY